MLPYCRLTGLAPYSVGSLGLLDLQGLRSAFSVSQSQIFAAAAAPRMARIDVTANSAMAPRGASVSLFSQTSPSPY